MWNITIYHNMHCMAIYCDLIKLWPMCHDAYCRSSPVPTLSYFNMTSVTSALVFDELGDGLCWSNMYWDWCMCMRGRRKNKQINSHKNEDFYLNNSKLIHKCHNSISWVQVSDMMTKNYLCKTEVYIVNFFPVTQRILTDCSSNGK